MPSHTVAERKKKKRLGTIGRLLVPGQIARKLFGKSTSALTTVQKKLVRERILKSRKK